MPKFYGQNKKRIDPRYFLNETTKWPSTDKSERDLIFYWANNIIIQEMILDSKSVLITLAGFCRKNTELLNYKWHNWNTKK